MTRWKNMNHKRTMTCLKDIDSASQTSQSLLYEVCTQSPFEDARHAAISSLKNPNLLVRVARSETDQEICRAAIEKLADDASLLQVAEHIFDDRYFCFMAINRINDQQMLYRIAQQHAYAECRVAAIKRLDDQSFLLKIAQQNSDPEARKAAIAGLKNQNELALIALRDPSSWVRRAAIAKLTDQELLADVALCNSLSCIRHSALLRLKELASTRSLSPQVVTPLLGLLNNSSTVIAVIELAEEVGVDWISKSSDATVQAINESFNEARGWRVCNPLDTSIKMLYKARPDLQDGFDALTWTNPYTNCSIVFSQE